MPDPEAIFTGEQREGVSTRLLLLAQADPRVHAAAVVGSLASGPGDRWSDLDLTFAVEHETQVLPVLDSLTEALAREFAAVALFDLPSEGVLYRVLLLRGMLQVDISAAPREKFGARGPRFRLLFGCAVEQRQSAPAPPSFGHAVHHALHARFCIERGRLWKAEFWLSETRHLALKIACARLGLNGTYGRQFDRLPPQILMLAENALPRQLNPSALQAALDNAIALLLRESPQSSGYDLIAARLHLLTRPL